MSETQQLPAIRPMVSAGGAVGALIPQTIDEAWRLSEAFALAGILPRGITSAPQVMLVICGGAEVGFGPFQSLQSFYLVNNRLTMWGDAIPALLWTHGFKIKEWFENIDPAYPDNMVAKCLVIRPTGEEIEGEFSVADAKEAKLWSKDGPWQTARKRMLKMRARAFAARDGAPDVLRGVAIREEVEDYQPIHDVTTATAPPALSADFSGDGKKPRKPRGEKAPAAALGGAPEAEEAQEQPPETQTAAQDAAEALGEDDLPEGLRAVEVEATEPDADPEEEPDADEAEKSDDDDVLPPEMQTFVEAVESVATFVEVKHAMATFFKTDTFKAMPLEQQNFVRCQTWETLVDRKTAGDFTDLPDHAIDVSAFRLWLEAQDDSDAISGTLSVLERQPGFAQKDDAFKAGIRAAVSGRIQTVRG